MRAAAAVARIHRQAPRPAWAAAWRTAWRRQAAGLAQAHIVCLGDSVTQGYYADAPYYLNGWPGVATTAITARTGVTPGTGWVPLYEESQSITDARTSRTGTWATLTTAGLYQKLAKASNAATFTLGPVTCSSFRICYLTGTGGGAWTATVDAGTPANYTSAGSAGVTVATIDAGGVGSHSLVLTASADFMYVLAVEAISNPTSGVKVSRLGYDSQTVATLIDNTGPAYSRGCYQALAADAHLALVAMGLNDAYLDAYTPAQFKTNLNTFVDDMQAIGASTIIVVSPPPNTATINDFADYRAVMLELVASEVCGVIDVMDNWTSRAVCSSFYYDNVHPNGTGHAAFGALAAAYIIEAATD